MEFPLGDGSTLMFLRDSGEAVILPDFNNLDALTVPPEYVNGGAGLSKKHKAESDAVLSANGKVGTEVTLRHFNTGDAVVPADVSGNVHHGRTKLKQEVTPVKGISISSSDTNCINGCAVNGSSKRIPVVARLVECSSAESDSAEDPDGVSDEVESVSLTDEAIEDVSECFDCESNHKSKPYDSKATSTQLSNQEQKSSKGFLGFLKSLGSRHSRCKN